MSIETFADLLNMARAQALPQRLLFVFADTELPEDATDAQGREFAVGQGGALAPSMCVDKAPDELPSFEVLVQEAAQFGQPWRLVFAGALSGSALTPPETQATEQALQRMVAAIEQGDIARYLAFDRHGVPMVLASHG